jgi:hypothetical protein
MQDRLRQTAVIGLALLDIGSSFWLGERLNQEASTTPVYFLPFGPTFAIWGLIFSSALVYGVYQALPTQRERSLHRRVGWWVAVNAGLTALWNFTAGSAEEPGNAAIRPLLLWSTVGILAGMLFSLTQAFIVLRRMDAELTSRDRWLTQFPITVFFAWLNVAMIANTTAALIGSDVTGGANGAVWAAGMLLIAAALASMMIIYSRAGIGTLTYSGVIIWAVIGIFFNNVNRSPLVTVISLAIIVVVSAVTIYHLSRPRRASQPGFQGALS